MKTLAPALILLAALPLAAQDAKKPEAELWLTDFSAAKALAKQKNLDLLLDFTGSDWCGYCIKLHEDVFDTAEFKKDIGASFVLVELDFPQRKPIDEATRKQNQELQAKFAIRGYPTIILTDAEGKPYAQTGFQQVGPEAYLKHLATLKEKRALRDAELEKAKSKKGIERAKALAAAVDAVDKGLRRHYADLLEEIVTLDADGKAGLKKAIEKERSSQLLAEKIDALEQVFGGKLQKEDFKGAMAVVDEFVATHKPDGENLQKLRFYKAIAAANAGDFSAAAKIAGEALEAAPDGEMAESLKQMGEEFKKRAAASKPKSEKSDEPEPKDGKK